MNEVIINNIKIDVRSSKSLYITIGNYIYYIDDSTNEQIMQKWIPEHISHGKFIRACKVGDIKLAKSYYNRNK
tara:strand:+ start:137 stop:355 length:219 start_codon:yes stop_codon:yes gene_type:complete